MKINGEAWPRFLMSVAMLAAGVVLVVHYRDTEGMMLIGAAIGASAPLPNWTKGKDNGKV